jgi:CheY-like chemotaxis protein
MAAVGDSMRVMVVDDEEGIIATVCRVLENGMFEAHGALGGKACIESIREVDPDILLMDVMMPDMNGWEVLRELKSMGLLDKIKVIMLTVVKEPKEEDADLSPYILDYIRKPFRREDLLKRVSRLSTL